MRSALIFSLCIWFVSASAPQNVCYLKGNQQACDLYEDLWQKNLDIAGDVLNSKFIQTMQSGSLPVHCYITFTLQDIYYLEEVTDMLKTLSAKVEKPEDLKTFFQERYKSYSDYTSDVLGICSLTDKSIIKPQAAIKNYTDAYRDVMNTQDPIYFAIAMLPCSRLWTHLAEKLQMDKNNAYYEFKADNMRHPEKHFKPLLDKYQSTIDVTLAHAIFRSQMKHERAFFQSAVP
ncbi:uncharacterized protein LOC118775244 [Megalops cyprinoides]|uniref:uncharacterized protein LOC118775244 n=1 Tax=Megalops cyprinoides TaxID=118141 RepID=UPI001864F0ED|nr:uncharacterized protein LOC118775244 [Megalops cyprinoides]